MSCICGNEIEYSECCQPVIDGKIAASSAEKLMRSRYSAYVIGDGNYLVQSAVKENRYSDDIELIEEFSNSVDWLKLDVINSYDNIVEFKAYYREGKTIKVLHEKSKFDYEDDMLRYSSGELFNSKVERNESCPCQSGKKFKKCCA
jgi:SEC-C motif-containing protein